MNSFKKYFWDVIIKHYFDYKSVATRKEYWLFVLYRLIAIFALAIILYFIKYIIILLNPGFIINPSLYNVVIIVNYAYMVIVLLVTLIPSYCVAIKRLHDIKLSGWPLLLFLIPYIGALIIFIFHLLPSETEHNKYIMQK
ncbi:MAG: DUF805 domain-containing protein [Candidatus Nomurabacteria bacterium]